MSLYTDKLDQLASKLLCRYKSYPKFRSVEGKKIRASATCDLPIEVKVKVKKGRYKI